MVAVAEAPDHPLLPSAGRRAQGKSQGVCRPLAPLRHIGERSCDL